MINLFDLTISACDEMKYNGKAGYCSVTTPEGSIGLEARHAPLLCVLKENSMICFEDSSKNKKTVSVKNGMCSFLNNTCTIVIEPA